MRRILRYLLPSGVRRAIRQMQKLVVYYLRRQAIRFPIFLGTPIKIIIGAAMTNQKGWYSTNEQWLDIALESHWIRIFHGKSLLTHVLAEHVFEHLTPDETRTALQLIARHMCPAGFIRIAVPDGYHPDLNYLHHVGVAGIGADAEDHKQLLNSDSLMQYLEEAGFVAELKEGYRLNGELVQQPLDVEAGLVIRSRSNALTMACRSGWDFVDAQTSLVVDGRLHI